MSRPSPHRLAVDALRLHGWAMRTLIAGDARVPPPQVSADAWRFFAQMEWCSQPLRAHLGDAGVWDRCDAIARRELTAAADNELRRIASARDEIARVAALAGDAGWKIVVLKGGATVAAGEDIHLADVDFGASAGDGAALVDALRASGLRGTTCPRETHFAAREPGGAVVEVHTRVAALAGEDAGWSGTVPLAGAAGLWRLPPAEHLWHLLHHAVVKHPDRAGRLRDLLVARHALRECTPAEVERVRARAEAAPERDGLLAVLELARAATPCARIEVGVRRRYFLLARWRWLGTVRPARAALQGTLSTATWMAGGRAGKHARLHVLGPTDAPSKMRALRWLGDRRPAAARMLRVSLRLPLVGTAAALAWGAALEAGVAGPREEPHPAGADGGGR
jgi:hypothetical protein